MIATRFWKIKRYLKKLFYRFFIQKIGYEMQNDKKTLANTNYFIYKRTVLTYVKE